MSPTPDNSLEGHTPTPWELVPSCEHHGAYITSQFGTTLCDLYTMSDPSALSVRNGGTSKPIPFTDMDANAAFIVRAVNAHDDLVAALRLARVAFDLMRDDGGWHPSTYAAFSQIDAALKKAGAP